MTTTTPPICSACNERNAASYFRVQRVSPAGAETPLTTVCSVKCLLQWTYAFASMRGMQLAYNARTAVRQFLDALKP